MRDKEFHALAHTLRSGSDRISASTPEKAPGLQAGDRFEVPYPFSRDTYEDTDYSDEAGVTSSMVPTWKVGPTYIQTPPEGDTLSVADALGISVLTVVSVHKPGKYPTRVFFTRTWVSPEGKAFGKTKCRITTVPTFRTLTQGFRHDFVLRGCKCKGCEWPFHDHRRSMVSTTGKGSVRL